MRRVVSLWLTFWPTDRMRRASHAALPPEAPLVTRARQGGGMTIQAACAAARGLGLRAGMSLAHAQAMVPGLVVADATPQEDAQALERLAAWCLRLSPLTAADLPDGVWIDATGCAHLHGGEAAMLRRLIDPLTRQAMSARAAIADTPGAAHALARFGTGMVSVVPPGSQAAWLDGLPVEALRIAAETASALRRVGLERIGQLAATPRGPLARRFGPVLLERLDQALGRVHEPLQPVLPPETIVAARRFAEPIATAEAFAAVILVLVREACERLERQGQGARRLDLYFERVDQTLQMVRIGTARPSRDPRHLQRLLDEQIERVDPGLGVEAMRLALSLVEPLDYKQKHSGLAGHENEGDLSELVDRLSNRLGSSKVYRLQPVQSDIPERSQRVSHGDAVLEAEWISPDWVSPWPRPVRLLGRPEPVSVLGMLPDHPPRAFTWRGIRHPVSNADGPERIAGEWWRSDDETVSVRDYWIVENPQGQRFWLFRQGDAEDPRTGPLTWFLHGFF